MKHSRISLLERAAEVYDFGLNLRAPEAITPAPAEPVASPEPPRAAPVPAPEGPPAAPAVRPVEARAPRRTKKGAVTIDRAALARAGCIVPEAPVTGLAEEFRLIKRQLQSDIARRTSLSEEKRRSILICSGQPREGKTFCALNLALSLSGEQDLEILLVDADFAKPDVFSTLGVEPGPGLVDALADPNVDPEAFVVNTDIMGLSLLSSGRRENNVPELLASERTRQVVAALAAADPRRLILSDSPPLLMASPASLIAGLVGQALVVVRADQTNEADLRETVGLLSGCDHVGLLLNGAGMAVSGRNYGAYDGYGHGD